MNLQESIRNDLDVLSKLHEAKVEGQVVEVGDVVWFKDDYETAGEITKINGNTLTLEVEGEGGVPWDTETRVVKASECWINGLDEGIIDADGGKCFKNKATASAGGKTAGKNKREEALRKYQEIMIDAAIEQNEEVFNKASIASTKISNAMYGTESKPKSMWSVAKAEAMKDGSFWKMPIAQSKEL
jgi:hypothetical protein